MRIMGNANYASFHMKTLKIHNVVNADLIVLLLMESIAMHVLEDGFQLQIAKFANLHN